MSEPIHILLTIKFDNDTLDHFRSISPNIKLRIHPAEKIKDVPNKAWEQSEILYTTHFLPPAKVNTESLRWIHSHYAGVDHLLHDPFIEAHPNVKITTSSGIHVGTIGEYVLGMILAFGHRIPRMIEHKRRAEWPEDRFKLFLPQGLRNSTVGILGYGRLGREVARLCKSFGAIVLATKGDVKHPVDTNYTLPGTGDPDGEMFDRLYPPEATGFMVKDCDYVVITLPLTDTTRNLVNEDILDAMKPSAYLINVGRGGIVDEDALAIALEEGKIAGAGFDVFDQEPLPSDSPLWTAPNFIISPHISGNMRDYNAKAATLFEENLRRYVAKEPLYNIVDRSKGY
jgi:phosphoglycerate dehydrogenase-like enzyme